MKKILFIAFVILAVQACGQQSLKVGAERMEEYLPQLEGKKVGLVGNQSSLVSGVHLVDSLLARGVQLVKVFSPEHGFRGKADAGEKVQDGLDPKSGLPVVSLYGSNKKPKPTQLEGIDVLLFDLQDVGARFYTYISTLHYVLEACAEAQIQVLVLDRPNPNGHYIDGPILDMKFQSFVGMHPVPVVHGMTMAEYARMIVGEGWVKGKEVLSYIPMENYSHEMAYELPVKPSPNLPNALAVALYPSLCFFEGTPVSVGRGTSAPFQMFGAPFITGDFTFVPQPGEGAKNPKLNGERCYGFQFKERQLPTIRAQRGLQLNFLISAYAQAPNQKEFFNSFFVKLAGTDQLEQQIRQGLSEEEIRATWQPGLEAFKRIRQYYLLYP